MTVSAQTPYSSQAANGVTTAFPFAYKVRKDSDLVVSLVDALGNETVQTLGVDYTVSGVGAGTGGTVNFTVAPANGLTVKTRRSTVLARTTDYQSNGDLLASILNGDIDAVWLALQELLVGAQSPANLLRTPLGEILPVLSAAASRQDKVLGFNSASGQPEMSTFTMTQIASALAAIYVAAAGPLDALSFLQSGTGAVSRTAQDKAREVVSIADFAADGVSGAPVDPTGVLDSTAGIVAALASAKHVIVPAGYTPLISSTVAVPIGTRLQFLGGLDSGSGANSSSYLLKKSTMTTPALTLDSSAWVDGGGIVGQGGNTGEGVQIIGNGAKLSNFLVHGAGGDGVRVGTASGANVNSFELDHVVSEYNGGHGFNIHDGKAASGADANAGPLRNCFAHHNTGDGFHLGHAWWVMLDTCLSESNTGWGIYLSGTANNTYPECRWPTVLGGDYNEGNTAGQIYDGSYFANFIQPDGANLPTTAPTGVQGGGYRNIIGGSGGSTLQGLTVQTFAAGLGSNPLTADAGTGSGKLYPFIIKQKSNSNNGDGPGLQFLVDPNTGTYRVASNIVVSQATTNQDNLLFYVNKTGTMLNMLGLFPNASAVAPGVDNAYSMGVGSNRWSTVYAATGTINTSDSRNKQQVRALSDAEHAVAVACKGLLRAFKFNDAVAHKGAGARIHFGVIAQEVGDAFRAHGLDPAAYGLFCYDEWGETPEQRDHQGHVVVAHVPAGNRYGVRYEELLAFMLAAL